MDGLISQPMLIDNLLDQVESIFRGQAGGGDAALKEAAEEELRTIQRIRALPIGIERGFQAQAVRFRVRNFDGDRPDLSKAYAERMKLVEAKYHVSAAAQNSFESALAVFFNEHNHFMWRDDRPLLASVRVPTLVIQGKDDHLITPAMAEIVHAGIEGSEEVLLDDCGHAPYADQPDKTASAVLAFVSKASKKRPSPPH
jgi:pimeloyl-ACP methyl ester carboxylesterase